MSQILNFNICEIWKHNNCDNSLFPAPRIKLSVYSLQAHMQTQKKKYIQYTCKYTHVQAHRQHSALTQTNNTNSLILFLDVSNQSEDVLERNMYI